MRASRCFAAANSAASSLGVQAGWWRSWLASIPIASGRYPHSRVSSPTAASSAWIPGRAASRASRAAPSGGDRESRVITAASSRAASRRRLVTSTRLPAVPGSSGRTCSWLAASSSSSRTFLPATTSRQRAARASSPGGICSAATPAVSSRLASASAGPTGRCPRVWACSGRKNWPSAKSPASRWAACTAKVVLPIPAIPSIAWMPTTPPSAARLSIAPNSWVSSAWRPVKAAVSRGSARVAAAANAPGASPCLAASTSAAGTLPRAAATNRSWIGPSRLSAPASNWAVSLWAVRLIPRSRSLTDRGERLAASASSSCVSRASARSCRNSPAKESPDCSPTTPAPLAIFRNCPHPAKPILHPQYADPASLTISRDRPGPGAVRPCRHRRQALAEAAHCKRCHRRQAGSTTQARAFM